MKVINGDLLKLAVTGLFDVIVHGCNCQCTMGAGIALQIKNLFPEAFASDRNTVKGDRAKLGSISTARVEREGNIFTIVNGYTQFHWRGTGVLVDYNAVRSVMRRVKAEFHGSKIGYPKIGAGLAKGDWSQISSIIEEELKEEDHTLVKFEV